MTLQERFDAKYIPEPNSGCFLWTASLTSRGYGLLASRRDGRQAAHRISWEMHHGPIPEGLQVCHKCDVRCCVNPDHLFLGTLADNMADRNAKGRQAKGRAIIRAKLTDDQVRAIRADRRIYRLICAEHGVSHGTVSQIKNRNAWKHVA